LISPDQATELHGHGRGFDVHVIAEAELKIACGVAVIPPRDISASRDRSTRGIDAGLDSVPDGGHRWR
jgi:hypothetical protein